MIKHRCYIIVLNKEFFTLLSSSKIKSTASFKEIEYDLLVFLDIKASYPL